MQRRQERESMDQSGTGFRMKKSKSPMRDARNLTPNRGNGSKISQIVAMNSQINKQQEANEYQKQLTKFDIKPKKF